VSNSPSSRRRRSPRPPDAVEAEDVVADDDLDDAAQHATAPSSPSPGSTGPLAVSDRDTSLGSDMMAVMPGMPPSDPFSTAVDKARQRLSYTRGRNISVRALARAAGIPEATLAYSLSAKRAASGRRVDADIVRKLAAVLPVDEADLMRAAQEAAGYRVREDAVVDPVAYVLDAVHAFYGNASIDQGQRDKVTAEILRIIADRM
jgi:transcriptional regulator with XRE-family HTH domain